MTKEIRKSTWAGIPVLLILLATLIATVAGFISSLAAQSVALAAVLALLGFVEFFLLFGLFMVQPNNAVVLQLFGRYVGTVRDEGLRWANPFYSKRAVSLRVRNFESSKLKVNELEGSPIEIAAVVVWQVVDSAEALFLVDDFENFVHVQSESALRQMATSYPYDAHDESKIALRSHSKEVSENLLGEIQERLAQAGVKVIEARISHLAYAPEIANAMLRRQQADAVIAARTRIVEGAVSMVEMALEQLSKRGVIDLDEERKASMVSNLLVVLCSDNDAQPVVNAGSLYG
ncbi:MAG: SPFH domain-containing protein [Xanthomonadales bacterium]|nr:SPFH domain-containing protein [Xanthomonadales bacterium]MCP5475272.1 SPFH domain-containing protein [Rhodanobacteraceae bacterium]